VTTNTIHPSAVIGEGVELGDDVRVGPFAVLLGPLVIGDRVWIGGGAQLGGPPEISSLRQNTAWTGDLDHAGVRIGDDAVIRENVVIHQGSRRTTTVGARSWILNTAYLAHDVVVGDDVTVSAGVTVGGHARIGDRANIGMNAAVHQGRVIGPVAMVGMATPVSRDVPPFAKAYGTPPRVRGVNAVGLSRMGHPPEVANALEEAFRTGAEDLVAAPGLAAIATQLEWWAHAGPSAPMSVDLGQGATR